MVNDIVEGGQSYLSMKTKEPVLDETHELFKGIDYLNYINKLQLLYMQGNSGNQFTLSKEIARIFRQLERSCGLKKIVNIDFMYDSTIHDIKSALKNDLNSRMKEAFSQPGNSSTRRFTKLPDNNYNSQKTGINDSVMELDEEDD